MRGIVYLLHIHTFQAIAHEYFTSVPSPSGLTDPIQSASNENRHLQLLKVVAMCQPLRPMDHTIYHVCLPGECRYGGAVVPHVAAPITCAIYKASMMY